MGKMIFEVDSMLTQLMFLQSLFRSNYLPKSIRFDIIFTSVVLSSAVRHFTPIQMTAGPQWRIHNDNGSIETNGNDEKAQMKGYTLRTSVRF